VNANAAAETPRWTAIRPNITTNATFGYPLLAPEKVWKTRLLRHLDIYVYDDHFIKAGSGQTEGKFKTKTLFLP
jgi:hypothetical protein